MNSIEILKALDEIGATPGKNDKQALLAKYLADDTFGDVVQYALNPFVNFGVRPSRYTGFAGNFQWTARTWDLLEKLAHRALTGNAAAAAIEAEYKELDADSAELLWRVLNKDLKGGFSESSCNKAKKGMFQDFPYMRCSLMSDVDLNKWHWAGGIISQEKADGMYTNFNNVNGIPQGVVLLGRSGERLPYEGFEQVHHNVSRLRTGTQSHGELLVIDDKGDVCAREIGNGIINKVRQGGAWPAGHWPKMMLWDQIPLESVVAKGSYLVPYVERLKSLSAQVREADAIGMAIIETRVVRSLAEAFKHYLEILRRGGEGTIIKQLNLIWKDHTSKGQIKLKLKAQVELRIKGYNEGKEGAKTAATFGSLALESEDGLLKVNCSGFTDEQRAEINANREKYLEGIVTVEFNGVMYAKRGRIYHSLFLPVFIEHRHDKTVADTFDQILKQVENAITQIEAQALSAS